MGESYPRTISPSTPSWGKENIMNVLKCIKKDKQLMIRFELCTMFIRKNDRHECCAPVGDLYRKITFSQLKQPNIILLLLMRAMNKTRSS